MQARALKDRGHDVKIFGRFTDYFSRDKFYKLKSSVTVATGLGPSPLEAIRDFKPDIVHVHNLFPNWGTTWVEDLEVPLVVTVHNFRPVCSAGTMLRKGSFCDLCPTKGSHNAVLHACYRSSRLATVPLAIASKKKSRPLLFQKAAALIFLSSRSKAIYESIGKASSTQSYFIPNFVKPYAVPETEKENDQCAPWVYVGRLSEEKGILELIRGWPHDASLEVLGDGPLMEQCVSAASGKKVAFYGLATSEQVAESLKGARGFIFPSLCTEMSALSYLEALASGTPTLAFSGNSVADDVAQAGTGIVFDDFQDLDNGLAQIESQYSSLARASRERFASQYSEKVWTKKIEELYQSVCSI